MSTFNAILARHELAPPLLYGISNRKLNPDLSIDQYLAALFKTRAGLIQWREKDLSPDRRFAAIEEGVYQARHSGKVFLVNTHALEALVSGADGVHLTSRQSPTEALEGRRKLRREDDFMIGQSVHTVDEALRAEKEGVDYLLLGPIFDPLSKQADKMPLGLPGLREAAYMLYTPVFALGGITLDKLSDVRATSAVGIAGISWLSEEIREITSGV